MTAAEIRRLIGDECSDMCGILDLVESANADPHEGSECLPRYKLALSLLAHAMGAYSAVFDKLIAVHADKAFVESLRKIQRENTLLWESHLRCLK